MCANICWAVEQLRASKTCTQCPRHPPRAVSTRASGRPEAKSQRIEGVSQTPAAKHQAETCVLISAVTPPTQGCPSFLSPALLGESKQRHVEEPIENLISSTMNQGAHSPAQFLYSVSTLRSRPPAHFVTVGAACIGLVHRLLCPSAFDITQ